MSALSEALVEANVDNLPGREIARRAGDRIHFATVNDYLRGRHGRPSEEVLSVFSEVLKIPMPKLRELAGLPAGELGPYNPPRVADRLNRRQRRVLNELIHLLAETSQVGSDEESESTNVTPLTPREKAQQVQKKAAQSKPRTDP